MLEISLLFLPQKTFQRDYARRESGVEERRGGGFRISNRPFWLRVWFHSALQIEFGFFFSLSSLREEKRCWNARAGYVRDPRARYWSGGRFSLSQGAHTEEDVIVNCHQLGNKSVDCLCRCQRRTWVAPVEIKAMLHGIPPFLSLTSFFSPFLSRSLSLSVAILWGGGVEWRVRCCCNYIVGIALRTDD